MHKERNAVNVVEDFALYQFYTNGVPQWPSPRQDAQTRTSGSKEFITYTNGRNRFNSCHHVVERIQNHGPSSTQFVYHDGVHTSTYTGLDWTDEVDLTTGPPEPIPPENGTVDFLIRAHQNLRPKFKGDVSLPNFLFELKDLKRLVPSWDRIQVLSRALPRLLGNSRDKKSRRARNKYYDEVAGQYLNANFGYLPLIDDIFKLIEDVKHFQQRLDTFRLYGQKPKNGHYKEVVPRSTSAEVIEKTYTHGYLYSVVEYSDIEWTAVIQYSYTIRYPDLYIPAVFARYIGFRFNPRIIWDALPFSFVLDWVLKFGKVLESFDDGALPLNINIGHACMSYKFNAIKKYYYRPTVNSVGTLVGMPDPTLVATRGYEVYKRMPIEPGSIAFSGFPPLPVADSLSVKEITLGLALGRTLTKSRRRS